MASREHCSASATRASNTCTAWVSRTACRLTFNDGHSDPQDLDRPHGNGHGHHWPRAVVPALRSHSPVFGSSGYAARPPCSAGRIPWPGRCRIQHSTTHRSTCRSYSMASCFSPETGRTTLRAATRSLSVVAAGGDCSPSRFRMQHESVSLHHLYHTAGSNHRAATFITDRPYSPDKANALFMRYKATSDSFSGAVTMSSARRSLDEDRSHPPVVMRVTPGRG